MSERVKLLRLKQLRYANRRALSFWSAPLTAFYLSLGAFAAASLTSSSGSHFRYHHPPRCAPRGRRCWWPWAAVSSGSVGWSPGRLCLSGRRGWRSPFCGRKPILSSRDFTWESNNGEQERAGLDGRSSQSVPAGLPGRGCGDSHHSFSGSPNSRSCGASWWHFMHDSTRPADVTCLPSAVTVP